MKKSATLVCTAAAVAAAVVAPAWSKNVGPQVKSPLTTKVNIDYSNQYVWRGILMNDGPVVQPSVNITDKSGVSLYMWGVFDNASASYPGVSGGVNARLDYAWTEHKFAMNAGVTAYTNREETRRKTRKASRFSSQSTNEVFLSTSLPGKITPTLSVSYDVGNAHGVYTTLGADYKVPLTFSRKVPQMNLFAQIGYGTSRHLNYYYARSYHGAFTDSLVSASFPIHISDVVTVAPTVTYTKALYSDYRDRMEYRGYKVDNITVGVNTSFSF